MKNTTRMLALFLVLVLAVAGYAQNPEATATQISSSITIDGALDESDWGSAGDADIDIQPSTNTPVAGGPITDENDCRLQVKLLWDSDALYVGMWTTDDQHYAPNSLSSSNQNEQYEDDAVEMWINKDFGDATADMLEPWYGTYGMQFIRALEDGGQNQFVTATDITGTFGLSAHPDADGPAMGYDFAFENTDGANYTFEMKMTWDSEVVGMSTPSGGEEVAMCFGIDDNDNGSATGDANGATIDGQMRWYEGDIFGFINNFWGKVILGSGSSVIPQKTSIVAKNVKNSGLSGVYDIMGRRISTSTRQLRNTGSTLYIVNGKKQMVLR